MGRGRGCIEREVPKGMGGEVVTRDGLDKMEGKERGEISEMGKEVW